MKKYIFTIFMILLYTPLFAAVHETLTITPSETTECRVTQQTDTGLTVTSTISDLTLTEITRAQGHFINLDVTGYDKGPGVNGTPQLPVINMMIEIPQKATVGIHILDQSDELFSLNGITQGLVLAPRQPARSKSITADHSVFLYDEAAYQNNTFITPDPVTVDILGTMRGVRMARLTIAPFSYNPQTNQLKVIGSITVTLSFDDPDLALTESLKKKYRSPAFSAAFKQLANYTPPVSSTSKDAITGSSPAYPLTYVVVASDDFLSEDSLQDFIDWKRRSGFHVIEANTQSIFLSSDASTKRTHLKDFLQDLYDEGDTPPVYVLFVGSVDQIPSYIISNIVMDGFPYDSHYTDLYYCDYTGDYLPEAYYGRFPVSTVSELNSVVAKTLAYESYTMASGSYLDNCMLIAGADWDAGPTYANGQVAYLINEYFNTGSGFSEIYAFLYYESWNWGGTVTTSPTTDTGLVTTSIKNRINDGVGIVNYTGHCSVNGWFNIEYSDYELDSNDIASLSNSDKYGVFVGNCCESSRFEENTCFGSTLVRASDKGAVAYIGAANETFWDQDFYWAVGYKSALSDMSPATVQSLDYAATGPGNFDALWHTHGEPLIDWYTTTGQMVYSGNLVVSAHSPATISGETHDYGKYYWEAYNVLGDPSLSPYLTAPETIAAPAIGSIIPCSDTQFSVTTQPNAVVALSREGELLDSAWSGSSGDVSLIFSPIESADTLKLIITKQNYQPRVMDVSVDALPDDVIPTASFMVGTNLSLSPIDIISGQTLTFKNKSSGCPDAFSWTFQNGTPLNSTNKNPSVTYTDLGLFSVDLTASNLNGSDDLTRDGYIRVSPLLSFSADKTRIYPGNTISFSGQSSHTPQEWSWTFQGGEPATSNEQNPVVQFNEIGAFTVSLSVTIEDDVYPLSGPQTKAGYIVVINTDTTTPISGEPISTSNTGCFIISASL